MNNASLQMNSNHTRKNTTNTEQSLRKLVIPHSDQNISLDLPDVSILSLGLTHYSNHTNEMLTDDDDDNEVIETSDDDDGGGDDDDDDEDDVPLSSQLRNPLLNNLNHNDDIDLGLIDPDTQAKLAAILEATGITNAPIPDDFWQDQQVVRLLTSSVTNNLNSLHEIANAMSPTVHQDKKCKSISKDISGTFVRACLNNDLRSVEKLLQSSNGKEHLNDVNEDGESVFAVACSNGYTDLVRLFLTTIPDIDVDDRGTKQDCTPLMEACNAGHYEIVELLLKHNANVNIQSTSGNTALHYSAGGGYADIVRLLLGHGAKVEETNENGHTPLMEAASGGHVEVARVLLDHGAGVNTHSNDWKDKNGNDSKQHKTDEMHTALMEACMDGHVQVAKLLLDHGADVNMPPDSYESPLTLSACGGHIELASLLIERGANLEEVNDEGYTPLMEASREGHDDLVNLLVSQGADVNRTTEDQQETALTLACAGGFLDVAKILINNGANVNLGQSTPLMEASQEGHIELVQYLIQHGADVNQIASAGETALSYACEGDHTEVAEILLNSGAHIDQTDNEGRTSLMKAVRAGHICTVQYLISKGADVNRSSNSNDSTVLSLACAGGHLEIASLLLKRGSNPNHLLKDRSNCLIEAAKGGHTEIVKLLLEYPKNVTQRTQVLVSSNAVQSSHQNLSNENDQEDEQENLTINSGDNKKLLQTNQVSKNLLDIHQTNNSDSKDNSLSNNDRLSIPMNETIQPTLETDYPQLNKKLQIIEQLQHAEEELHDKAQQQLEINQEYREQVNEYIHSNSTSGKKKRTTSSSSTSSSSSVTSSSSSSNAKHEDISSTISSTSLSLPILSQTINFFSTPPIESNPSNNLRLSNKLNLPSLHHSQHHSKIKKSFNRQSTKNDRRLEQNIHDNQIHLDQMNQHLKNLKLLSPTTTTTTSTNNECLTSPTKISMHINTDTQKALEHLRELANNPLKMERIQTLKNHPNLIQEIRKVANQSFSDQLKTLPPFIPANLQQSVERENKSTNENLEQIEPMVSSRTDSTVQTVPSSNLNSLQTVPSSNTRNLNKVSNSRSLPTVKSYSPPLSPSPSSSQSLSQHSICCADCPSKSSHILHSTSNTTSNHLRFQNRIDVDCETESNHDTALTLSCAGGHEELVSLLLHRGANIEHRDKKGFTPLILAATAGHANIVARLLENGAMIEAQSERTKDTALSLACSGGRQDVVEVLLKKGANREHRNVSDYTALSLAASGGYVNIIRLLLNYGAEINSRTGSKLGITPLMLASMNGHVAAVKLLLDMGADVNAQIETNRNTALTLACFQGRAEVVSLLVDRKANIEHRAKTGLTPLMESASGGYVDVGSVLLKRGADVNALPVPTSKDTALTIAADKGHHKFVELLLLYGATIDVRNKKGATPLWLACNNGHLEVVQLLVSRCADPDSSDSRKVSCLMAAFRRGHSRVVKFLVRQVRQFPSDADCRRLINTITDKDLLKKCQACMDQIISAKERQAAEANKAANSLLKEIDLEKSREETRKVAAAKKREKRKAKKKGKQKSTIVEPIKTTDERAQEVEEDTEEAEEDHDETEHPSQPETSAATSVTAFVVDDGLNLNTVDKERELSSLPELIRSPPPPPSPSLTMSKQPMNNKKKTNTMTRKIERHQENLASKNKQQESSASTSGRITTTTTTTNANTTDDGWQEVIGKQKKITIPHEQYARVIGRSGSNLNVLREVTGASIEVENKKAIGDKTILIKGNGDSIKHAHQLIMALLKNSETELMSLLPASNEVKTKPRSATVTINNDNQNDDETVKTQRTNTTSHGLRIQHTEPTVVDASSNNNRSSMISNKKITSTNPTRSTSSSSSSTVKTSQPLTATGATWINSNRINRGASSSTATSNLTSNTSNITTAWNNQLTSTRPSPGHNKTSHSNHYSTNQTNSSSSYHYSYSNNNNSTNNHNHYGSSSKQNNSSNRHYSTNSQHKTEHSIGSETISQQQQLPPPPPPKPLIPSQPGHRIPIPALASTSSSDSIASSQTASSSSSSSSSLLVVSSSTPTPNVTKTGEYNPFASNILTTSIVDVLTKTKDPTGTIDESNSSSGSKMNFANVAKMNVPFKSSYHEPIVVAMNEPMSPALHDPKIAPGYRGPPSAGTTPTHQTQSIVRTANYDSLSPTSQLSRAPGAHRHQQPISPSMNKVLLDQNGQPASSATSSTSSSPSSIKQQNAQLIQPSQQQQQQQQQQSQQQPFGPIGAHRPPVPNTVDVAYMENPLQMRTKFNRTLSANNAPMYQQAPPPPPSPMMSNNPAYANISRSRSNLNPTAPEFQHGNHLPPQFIPPLSPSVQVPINNGPLSANIISIARMMEQKQQQLYTNNVGMPIHPSQPLPSPPPPVIPSSTRSPQQAEMEAMQQHVQNQVLHYWRIHASQQQQQQQLAPPPPQLPTTLQIANILASKGQLPQDPNQAAALVAAYYYTTYLTRAQQPPIIPNNIPLSSNVNKNVYETMNIPPQPTVNSDDIPLTTVDPINGQVQPRVMIDPNMIMANSNHSTGPSPTSSSNTAGIDHKMVPAAIGSERKRNIPGLNTNGPIPIGTPTDWSSVHQQSYPIEPYLQQQQQQQQIPLSSEYQPQQSTRDYTR